MHLKNTFKETGNIIIIVSVSIVSYTGNSLCLLLPLLVASLNSVKFSELGILP